MDPIFVAYGFASAREDERRRLNRELERMRLVRERLSAAHESGDDGRSGHYHDGARPSLAARLRRLLARPA